MTQPNQTQKTIMEQCNWNALRLAGFKFIAIDDNTIRLHAYHKSLDISYQEASDDYNIQTHTIKGAEVKSSEILHNIYCDQLQEQIMNFWQIEIPEFRLIEVN